MKNDQVPNAARFRSEGEPDADFFANGITNVGWTNSFHATGGITSTTITQAQCSNGCGPWKWTKSGYTGSEFYLDNTGTQLQIDQNGVSSRQLNTIEVTAPSGIAGDDVCYGDSTAHALKCSYNNGTFFQIPQVITATSAAFATATTAGTCVQNTTAVTNAATSMSVSVSPVSTPGVGAVWSAFVSSAGNVTINECAVATSAGGTIAFNIRVTP